MPKIRFKVDTSNGQVSDVKVEDQLAKFMNFDSERQNMEQVLKAR